MNEHSLLPRLRDQLNAGLMDRREFVRADAIVNDARQGARRADFGEITVAAEGALEQIQVGAPHQDAFERKIEEAGGRAPAIMQATAVWRIDPDGVRRARKPRVGSQVSAM